MASSSEAAAGGVTEAEAMSDVRWGILGAAKFAREFMGPALTLAPGGHVAALATSDPAKADPFRVFAPGVRVHGSYEALLADPDIDAVYIPLPNPLHVEWSVKAMKAGKHVLCEKPMAMEAGDFDGLIAARDAAGVLAAEAFMIVHHPQWQRARQLLAEGAVGRLRRIDGAFSYNNRDASNIRNQAGMGGGGLRDIGVYVLGGARFATGLEPTEIRARIDWEDGVDVYAALTARFGEVEYVNFTSIRMHPRQEITFHGDAPRHGDRHRALAGREPLRAAGRRLQPRGARRRGVSLPAGVLTRNPGGDRRRLRERRVGALPRSDSSRARPCPSSPPCAPSASPNAPTSSGSSWKPTSA